MFLHQLTRRNMMALLYTICIAFFMSGTVLGQQIISPPSPATGIQEESASFQCEVDAASTYVEWYLGTTIVYYYDNGQEGYPQGQGDYLVEWEGQVSTFTISNLEITDAGQYGCKVARQSAAYTELLVLGEPSVSQITDNKAENSIAIFLCKVDFGGPDRTDIGNDHYPELAMFLEGTQLDGTVDERLPSGPIQYYTFTMEYNLTLEASLDQSVIRCEISTRTPSGSVSGDTLVDVHYSVRNPSYIPNQAEYLPGQLINCTADGNPEPIFTWRNMESGEYLTGRWLHITEDMVGLNLWKCEVENTVDGIPYTDMVLADFYVAGVPVRDIKYEPIKSQYEVGEVIKCQAEGNPSPTYEWRDTSEGISVQGNLLNITEDFAGFSVWECTASNTLNGEVHTISITAEIQVGCPQVPVHSISYAPMQEQYQVGEVISCSAEGYPPPAYRWQAISGGSVISGPSLHITQDLIGRSTWLCIAENVANGNMYNDSITVPLDVELRLDETVEIYYQENDEKEVLIMGTNETLMDLPILLMGLKSALLDSNMGTSHRVDCESIELVSSLDDILNIRLTFVCQQPDLNLLRIKHGRLLLREGWVSHVYPASMPNVYMKWNKPSKLNNNWFSTLDQ